MVMRQRFPYIVLHRPLSSRFLLSVAHRSHVSDFVYELTTRRTSPSFRGPVWKLWRHFLGQGMAGGPFWRIMAGLSFLTLAATTLAIFIGFVLALVNRSHSRQEPFRTVYLLPWAVPALNHHHVFRSVFLSGPLTTVLNQLLGNTDPSEMLNTVHDLGNADRADSVARMAREFICFPSLHRSLQGIPNDLYGAAESIDWRAKLSADALHYDTDPAFPDGAPMIGHTRFNFTIFRLSTFSMAAVRLSQVNMATLCFHLTF